MFWGGPNFFGWIQIILVRLKLDFSGLIFMIWTCAKWLGPDQYKVDLSKNTIKYSAKIIWTVQNHFGPIEGHGIRNLLPTYSKILLKTLAWNFNDESTWYFNRRSTLWSFESKSQGPVNCGQFWWILFKHYDTHSAIWFDFIKLFVISF